MNDQQTLNSSKKGEVQSELVQHMSSLTLVPALLLANDFLSLYCLVAQVTS